MRETLKKYNLLMQTGAVKMDETIVSALETIFSLESHKLPEFHIIDEYFRINDIMRRPSEALFSSKQMDGGLGLYLIREAYTKHAFVIYTNQLLNSMKAFVNHMKFKEIHELCSGPGWLTYWMRQYGIQVKEAVDNHSWKQSFNEFLPMVKNEDAVRHVRNTPESDLYVLSWPYMNDTAARIWKDMRPGQHLMYIGEIHGCCANDEFFQLICPHEVNDPLIDEMNKNFIRFLGLHDQIYVYKK